MSWRAIAEKVVSQVWVENPGLDEKAMRKKLAEAYPFGERKYHPYKIWLSAVKNAFRPPSCRLRYSAPVKDCCGQAMLTE